MQIIQSADTHDFPEYLLLDVCDLHPWAKWALINEIRAAAYLNTTISSVILYEKTVLKVFNAFHQAPNSQNFKVSLFNDISVQRAERICTCSSN